MNKVLTAVMAGLVLGFLVIAGTAAETLAAADQAAQQDTPTQQSEPAGETNQAQDQPGKFQIVVGAGEDGEQHGITITVDDDEEPSTSPAIAGDRAQRIAEEIESALRKLPAELREQLDDEDIGDLREAFAELKQLDEAKAERRHHDSNGPVELLVPIVALLLPVLIVAIVSTNNRRKREMVHQTIDRIIEQGRDVPVELLDALDKGSNDRSTKSSLTKGTVNVALGIGIGVALWAMADPEVATIGLIWFCVGCAQLLNWKLQRNEEKSGMA